MLRAEFDGEWDEDQVSDDDEEKHEDDRALRNISGTTLPVGVLVQVASNALNNSEARWVIDDRLSSPLKKRSL